MHTRRQNHLRSAVKKASKNEPVIHPKQIKIMRTGVLFYMKEKKNGGAPEKTEKYITLTCVRQRIHTKNDMVVQPRRQKQKTNKSTSAAVVEQNKTN